MGITYTLHGNWKEVGRRRIAHENVVEVRRTSRVLCALTRALLTRSWGDGSR
jgi:hypothetical protein